MIATRALPGSWCERPTAVRAAALPGLLRGSLAPPVHQRQSRLKGASLAVWAGAVEVVNDKMHIGRAGASKDG